MKRRITSTRTRINLGQSLNFDIEKNEYFESCGEDRSTEEACESVSKAAFLKSNEFAISRLILIVLSLILPIDGLGALLSIMDIYEILGQIL